MMKLRQIHNAHFDYLQKINEVKKLPKEEIKQAIEKIKDEYIEEIRQILYFKK